MVDRQTLLNEQECMIKVSLRLGIKVQQVVKGKIWWTRVVVFENPIIGCGTYLTIFLEYGENLVMNSN